MCHPTDPSAPTAEHRIEAVVVSPTIWKQSARWSTKLKVDQIGI